MLLDFAHEVVGRREPLLALAQAVLAAYLPHLDQQEHEVEQSARLVLVADCLPYVEFFLKDLLSRIVVAEELGCDVRESKIVEVLAVLQSDEEGGVARQEAVRERLGMIWQTGIVSVH